MTELPRGTVTLLFTDIEGSTRLLQDLGPETYVRALEDHRRVLRDVFGAHGGVEVEMQGDSFHFAFPDATEAVLAAAEAQRKLAAHPWEAEPIRVRIGIHTGEPVVSGELYAGLDVHRAARVMGAGHGGQVLLSDATHELVAESLPELAFLDLGEHRLKDLVTPVRLYQLGTKKFPPPRTLERETVADMLRGFVTGVVADRLVESGGTLPEERRLITALFADLTGFTALADRLDPEELLDVIDPVIAALSGIVGRYDGYIEKYAGDALLALFGAPTSHEDDAARAMLVALEMHRELATISAKLPSQPELALHIGVNSGHGIARILGSDARMDYAVLGDSVILAQRLAASAPPGETYVSESTVRLTDDGFEFEPVGKLTLKGISEPVAVRRLTGARAQRLPRRGRLVGRTRELSELDGVLDRLAAGQGAVVTLTGEPGVGKSRLSQALSARAAERELRWLETRCLSYGAGLAYWPYAELVRGFAGAREAPDPAGALRTSLDAVGAADAFPYFAHILGVADGAPEVSELEPEALRRAIHRAFVSWARDLARVRPTVIAIEDVHWSDAASLALTGELARLCVDEALVVYLVARPEADRTLTDVVGAAPRVALALEPLDAAGVGALIQDVLEGEPPSGLADFIHSRTAGNPLFAHELVRSLLETAVLAAADGAWLLQAGWEAASVPPTLEALLSSRIDLLPRAATRVLQTASVIGRTVPLLLLEGVLGAPGDLDLEQLVHSGFLDRQAEDGDEAVAFHHALVQDVAYARLLRRQRRDLHRRVADVAESLYGSADETVALLARHLYLGEAGAKALEYLLRAGDRARRLFANEEAIVHFTHAAELAEPDRRHEIELDLADLHELVGGYDEALRLYTRVKAATGDVRAWRGIAATLRKQGRYSEALAIVDEAFATEALRGADLSPLWLEQGWTLSVAGRFDEAIDVLEAGIEAAGHRRDPVVAQLLLQLARAESVAGRYDDSLRHGEEARVIFETASEVRGLATALRILGNTLTALGRLDEAAATLRRGLAFAEQTGSVEEIGGCLINLGLVERKRGALAEAIACDRRAIDEFERIGHGSGRAQGYANLAEKLGEAGEFDEALAYCEKALALAQSIGHTLAVADTKDTIAAIKLRLGEPADAAAQAEEAAELYAQLGAIPQAAASRELAAKARREADRLQLSS